MDYIRLAAFSMCLFGCFHASWQIGGCTSREMLVNGKCEPCPKRCESGKGYSSICGSGYGGNSSCEDCRINHYNEGENLLCNVCRNCTRENRMTDHKCHRKLNAVCGHCLPGFADVGRGNAYNEQRPCQPCEDHPEDIDCLDKKGTVQGPNMTAQIITLTRNLSKLRERISDLDDEVATERKISKAFRSEQANQSAILRDEVRSLLTLNEELLQQNQQSKKAIGILEENQQEQTTWLTAHTWLFGIGFIVLGLMAVICYLWRNKLAGAVSRYAKGNHQDTELHTVKENGQGENDEESALLSEVFKGDADEHDEVTVKARVGHHGRGQRMHQGSIPPRPVAKDDKQGASMFQAPDYSEKGAFKKLDLSEEDGDSNNVADPLSRGSQGTHREEFDTIQPEVRNQQDASRLTNSRERSLQGKQGISINNTLTLVVKQNNSASIENIAQEEKKTHKKSYPKKTTVENAEDSGFGPSVDDAKCPTTCTDIPCQEEGSKTPDAIVTKATPDVDEENKPLQEIDPEASTTKVIA